MATLHIHVDESGEFNFSATGCRYYIFTAAWTYDPLPLASALSSLRHNIIKAGHGSHLSAFHACEDPNPRRDLVINTLLRHTNWDFASIVVDKPCVNPAIREPKKFYPKFLAMVLRFIFRGRIRQGTDKVLIYADTLPFQNKKQTTEIEIAIKSSCRNDLPPTIAFEVCNHRRESNYWLQIADYCSWSVCRKWEHGHTASYDQLKMRLASPEIAPMSRGDGTRYY